MKARKNILVVGSAMLDMIARMDRIPLPGESYIVDELKYAEGGKGGNQAVEVAKMGAYAVISTCVGKDQNGMRLLNSFESAGVDISIAEKTQNVDTGVAIVLLENNGANRIVVSPGANMVLGSQSAIKYIEKSSPDAVLLQFEMPQQTVIDICNACARKNIPVVLDAGPAQPFPLEKIESVYIISPNETEAFALCGVLPDSEGSALHAAQLIKERIKCEYVVIKRGAQGACLYGNGIFENYYPPKVSCVDTTAAGDSFTAALTVLLAEGMDIKSSVKYANCAGSLATTKQGAQPSLPLRSEVEALFERTYR